MGTAHGRIRIDYEGDGFNQTEEGFRRVSNSADQSDSRMRGLAKTIGNVTTTMAALGPVAAQVAAAGAAAAATLGAAFVAAGASLGAFKAAVQPQFEAITEVGKLYDDAMKAVSEGSAQATEKVRAYKEALAQLPPATQQTATAFFGLKNDFKAWSDSLAGDTMPVFTRGINLLRQILPLLSPLVRVAASALGDLMTRIEEGASGGGIQRLITSLTVIAKQVLPAFLNSAANISVGLGGIFKAFLPFSTTMTGGIEELTAKFAAWGQQLGGSSGFQAFMDNMKTQGPIIGQFFSDLVTIITKLIVAFAPFLGATTQIVVAFTGLVAAIPTPVLSALIGVVTALTVAMKVWAITQALITAGTKAWTIAQAIFNAVMLANPIVLIIVAIAALIAIIVLIATKTDWFSKLWDKVWGFIKTAVSTAVKFVVYFVKKHWPLLLAIMLGPLGIILGLIIKNFGAIKRFIMGAVNGIIDFVRKNWRLIITVISGPLGLVVALVTKYWSQIWNLIRNVGNNIVNFIRGFNSRVLSIIRSMGAIVGTIAGIFNRFNQSIISRAGSALKYLGGLPRRIIGVFGGAGSWLRQAGINIIQGLINGIISMFNRLRDTLGSVTRALPDWKGPASVDRKLLTKNGQLIMGSLIKGFMDALPQVQASLNNVTNMMQTQTASSLSPIVTATDSLAVAPSNAPIPFSGSATLPDNLVDRLVDAMTRAGVGTVIMDGQVVSDVVGKIQGRAASFKRRTR